MSRVSLILVTAAGNLLMGVLGAFLVWNFIYSIGARVMDDATYARLQQVVLLCGGLAGFVLALWSLLVFRRVALGFLVVAHVVAIVLGFGGGRAHWELGLWGYFGGFGIFALLSLSWRKRYRKSRARYRHGGADSDWADDCGDGWSGGDCGDSGGGGD